MSKTIVVGLATDGHGGCEYNALSFTKFLRTALSWDVHVALPRTESTQFVWELCWRNDISVVEIESDYSKADNLKKVASDKESWWRVLDEVQPDACFVPLPWPKRGLSLVSGAADCGLPTVVKFALVPEVMDVPGGIRSAWRSAYQVNHSWFANSRYSASLIEGHFGLPKRSVDSFHVGPIGLNDLLDDGSPVMANASRSDVRSSLGIPGNACVAITVARLAEQKGYRVYMDIVRDLLEAHPSLWLIWVGDGELRDTLEKEVAALPWPDRVKLVGFRSDVRQLLRASDLFVFPTLYEGGCSQALLEAMEEGVPVAITNVSAVAEVVAHERTGLLFSRQDGNALRSAIDRMIAEPNLRAEMAARGALKVRRYSKQIMYLNTVKQLDKAMGTNYAGELSIVAPLAEPGEIPHWFAEEQYLDAHPDVNLAVQEGAMPSGYFHFQVHGRYEDRSLP